MPMLVSIYYATITIYMSKSVTIADPININRILAQILTLARPHFPT